MSAVASSSKGKANFADLSRLPFKVKAFDLLAQGNRAEAGRGV